MQTNLKDTELAQRGFAAPEFHIQEVRILDGCDAAFSAEWSEDGRYLFFQCRVGDEEQPKVASVSLPEIAVLENLHLVTPTARQSASSGRRYPMAPYPEEALSPDGKKRVFVGLDRGVRNAFFITPQSKKPQPLTPWPFDTFKPSWSADGKYLALYTRFHPQALEERFSVLLVPGESLRPQAGLQLTKAVIATDVLPDESGPQFWKHLLFTIRDFPEGDFLAVTDLEKRRTFLLNTGFNENRKIRVSSEGILAIEALVGGDPQILIATVH